MTTLIELEEPYRSIQAEARAVGALLEPIAVEADRSDDEHPEVRRILSESGLFGYMVPGAFGGKSDQLNAYNTFLGDPGYFAADRARYRDATPATITAAASNLSLDRRVLLSVVPQGRRDLALSGSTPVHVS